MPDPQAPGADAQKKTLRAAEQDRAEIAAERESYREKVKAIGPDHLVFVDESGIATNMVRTYARAPRGKRACGAVPFGSWRRLTVLGALSREGVVAAMSIEAATDTPVFLAYLEQVLVPTLKRTKPDATVVMDNLAPHRAGAVVRVLEQAGLGLLYLPRYSPDLSPIEPAWSKLKMRLRATAARSIEALDAELGPALDAITASDARGWFKHCGYALN
jgi:transposase